VSPRQESSHCSWFGARRSGIGRASGIALAGVLDKCIRLVYGVKAPHGIRAHGNHALPKMRAGFTV
jgi:hypothetical protein